MGLGGHRGKCRDGKMNALFNSPGWKWFRRSIPWPIRHAIGIVFWLFVALPIFVAYEGARGVAVGWRDAVYILRKARE